MAPRLEALPLELIEHIVAFLGSRDTGALRLTSRAIESKASKGSFATLFDHKTIRLEPDALRRLGHLVSSGHLGCLLRNCTITGIIRARSGVVSDSSNLRTLLFKLFRTLKERSPVGCLTSLSLDLIAHNVEAQDTQTDLRQDWTAVWRTARSTFEVVILALVEAQLSIDGILDIFGSLRGCSLECDAFLNLIRQPATKLVIGSLRGLSLSLSLPVDSELDSNDQRLSTTQEPIVLNKVLEVLSLMPSLSSFDYHWYTLQHTVSLPLDVKPKSRGMPPPRLKHCGIRGARLSSSDLIAFFNTTRPLSVVLADVDLTSGTYAPIFEYLTDPNGPVEMFRLEDLREPALKMVHFEAEGDPKFRYRGGNVGPSTLTRQATDARRGIRYRLPPGRPLGAGERNRWLKNRADKYGPPGRNYNFMELNSTQS